MKREILFRLFRILLVIVFVVFLSIIRNDVEASYKKAEQVTKQMPSFIVTPLSNNIDKSAGLKEEHLVNIKNVSNSKENISFVLKDANENFPYDHMNYTILKDNKVVKEGIIKENEILYKDEISSQKNSSYKIVFTISENTINNLGGISTSAKLSFI